MSCRYLLAAIPTSRDRSVTNDNHVLLFLDVPYFDPSIGVLKNVEVEAMVNRVPSIQVPILLIERVTANPQLLLQHLRLGQSYLVLLSIGLAVPSLVPP